MMSLQHRFLSQPLAFRSRSGQLVAVRQGMETDSSLLAELLLRLSDRARHMRYMSLRHFSTDLIWSEALRMAQGHSFDHTTLLATTPLSERHEAVAVAELVRDPIDPTIGEVAVVVRDDAQHQGIGSFLLRRLVFIAQHNDMTRLSANMLAENKAMLRLINALGLPYTARTSYGETQVLISLARQPEEITPARSVYKHAA
jgi:RimJ/RimL family protein N-acetyltransferase